MTHTSTRPGRNVLMMDAAVSLRAARLMAWIQALTATLLTASVIWGMRRFDPALPEPSYWRHDWIWSWHATALTLATVALNLAGVWLSRRFRYVRTDHPGVAVALALACCVLISLPALAASLAAPWINQRLLVALPHGAAAVVMVVFTNPWIERYTARMAAAVKEA